MATATVPQASPVLKWAGGKGQLLPQMERYFPDPASYDAYCEPFLGGGAVFFHLAPRLAGKRIYLSDHIPEIINVYRVIRDHPDRLVACLRRHKDRHGPEYYYAVRRHVPDDPVEQAARTIYLNKTCYNGLYRVNSRGEFNVPMGRYKNPAILDEENLRRVHQVLNALDVTLAVADFAAVLDWVHSTGVGCAFVYFDPPYQPLSATANFTQYIPGGFPDAEQQRLAGVFAALARAGHLVMLSNSYHPRVAELYQGFHLRRLVARRAINSRADRRGPLLEYLVLSYPAPVEDAATLSAAGTPLHAPGGAPLHSPG